MRIFLPAIYFNWGGGVDFLIQIMRGLNAVRDKYGITLFLLLPVNNYLEDPVDYARFIKRSIVSSMKSKQLNIVKTKLAFDPSLIDFFNNISEENTIIFHENNQRGLLRALKKINADIIIPVNGTLGRKCPIPWVGYTADFQHKYYPQYFTEQECLDRDIHFSSTYRDASSVIVNSNAVKNDIYRFFPYTETEVFNLPFSPCPLPEYLEDSPDDVVGRYDLPQKYFLVSNQFWVHKDHFTLFKALARLFREQNFDLVCTGKTYDYRRPEYQDELKTLLKKEGIQASVRLLGHIPKRDQIEIMKKSVAIIQPTLFEGGPGGGCVYDAIAYGVPVILSDIPVNKEIETKNIWFFKAGDSEELAQKMLEVLKAEIQRPAKEELLQMGQANLEKLGDRLLEAVYSVI